MRYGSVCSGIEAASVAWQPLGWQCQWVAEVDPFASAVLQHHYPDVPNLGDITAEDFCERATAYGDLDVLIGGTPCQSFSVAGRRAGLADERGRVAFAYTAIVARMRPRYIVWENVPGVLSSNGGRDFGAFLRALADLGYGLCYRVLDAQYFGLAQRRKRVFVVGCADGSCERAGQVLALADGLSGHPAPCREAGQDVAATIARSAGHHGRSSPRGDGTDNLIVADPLVAKEGGTYTPEGANNFRLRNVVLSQDLQQVTEPRNRTQPTEGHTAPLTQRGRDHVVWPEVAGPVQNRDHKGPRNYRDGGLQACAIDSLSDSLDITGITQEESNANATKARPPEALRRLREAIGEEAFCVWGLGIAVALFPAEALRQAVYGSSLRLPPWERCWAVDCALSRPEDRAARAMQSVREACGVGRPSPGWESAEQFAGELGAYLSRLPHASSSSTFLRDLWEASQGSRLLREALSALEEIRRSLVVESEPTHAGRIRRLMPCEAEVLQGFPMHHTLVPWTHGKPAADTPRYKAIGNSMAVPVIRWLGQRIMEVDA